jgi:hypothetical protein
MATAPESHSAFLLRVMRFCMLIRSKLGIKIDAVRLVDERDYAASIFQQIQERDDLAEDVLVACVNMNDELSRFLASKEKPAGNGPEPPAPPGKRDLKYGPRG